MALTSKRSLTKKDEETVKELNKHVKTAELTIRISPKIIAEWKADGGTSGTYKTPQEYYEAYYGDIDF